MRRLRRANEEGWIVTVAHLWDPFFTFEQHTREISDYSRQLQIIEQDPRLDHQQKHKRIGLLKPNLRWITNHPFWWGRDGARLKDIRRLPEADLAIGRLEPFDSRSIPAYPVLKDPFRNLDVGTSLCKLGFPFHEIKASFNETANAFELAPNTVPLPRFPIEGIYTRNVVAGRSQDGRYEIKFLETSTPGLRGQSGGPIFDTNGTVWAIQSRTHHYQLGFSPKVLRDGREIEEIQFLNVGCGVHPELITAFLRDNRVRFRLSDY
jgi:hypothetical protein